MAKDRGEVVGVEHIGSAHTNAELVLLLTTAQELRHPGQEALDLGPLPQVEAVSTPSRTGPRSLVSIRSARAVGPEGTARFGVGGSSVDRGRRQPGGAHLG